MKKQRHHDRQERGIALLFALGLISLLLVMALAFATNAIIARKTAANNSARTQAKTLAESAINRLEASLFYYQATNYPYGGSTGTTDPRLATVKNLVSAGNKDATGTIPMDYQLLQQVQPENPLLLTNEQGINYYPLPAAMNSPQIPRWQLIADQNKKLVGRYAYAVLPAQGKLAIPALNAEAVLDNDGNGTPDGKDSLPTPNVRLGAHYNELRDLPTITNSGYTASLPAAKWDTTNVNKLQRWLAPAHMLLGLNGTGIADQTARDARRRDLEIFEPALPEVYVHDNDSTSFANTQRRFYHRFNLARTDWNNGLGLGVNSDNAVLRLLGEGTGGGLKEYAATDTVTPVETPLPYLRRIGNTQGVYPDLLTRRKQIAANLLDYSDGDNISTSDSSNWWTQMPTYTGNEKSAYLNEVAIGFELNAQCSFTAAVDPNPPRAVLSGTVTPTMLALELFYPYSDATGAAEANQLGIEATATVEVLVNGTSVVTQDVTLSNPGVAITPSTPSPAAYNTIQVAVSGSSVSFTSPAIDNPTADTCRVTIQIRNLQIQKLHLTTGVDPLDFARELTNLPATAQMTVQPTSIPVTTVTEPLPEASIYVGYEVNDARDNLYSQSWRGTSSDQQSAALTPGTMPSGGTTSFGARNQFSTYETDGDQSDLSSPDKQPYFRNGPMKSPLELGYIHRAAPGETLNISASTARNTDELLPSLNDPGTTFADGDGGILDQIKMTWSPRSYGKINLNLRDGIDDAHSNPNYPTVIRLFRGLFDFKVGGSPTDALDGNGDTTLAPVAIANSFNQTTNARYTSRANAINDLVNAGGAQLNTLAKKKEFVGKVINLTDALPFPLVFQAVVVAQTIKDVGDTDVVKSYRTKGMTTPAAASFTGVASTEFGKLDVLYDASNNVYTYADDITSEIKMLVTIVRDPITGKFHVVSREQL